MSWQDEARLEHLRKQEENIKYEQQRRLQQEAERQRKAIKDAAIVEQITGVKIPDYQIKAGNNSFEIDGWIFSASQRELFRDDDGVLHMDDVVIMRPVNTSGRYRVYTVKTKAEIGAALADYEANK